MKRDKDSIQRVSILVPAYDKCFHTEWAPCYWRLLCYGSRCPALQILYNNLSNQQSNYNTKSVSRWVGNQILLSLDLIIIIRIESTFSALCSCN